MYRGGRGRYDRTGQDCQGQWCWNPDAILTGACKASSAEMYGIRRMVKGNERPTALWHDYHAIFMQIENFQQGSSHLYRCRLPSSLLMMKSRLSRISCEKDKTIDSRGHNCCLQKKKPSSVPHLCPYPKRLSAHLRFQAGILSRAPPLMSRDVEIPNCRYLALRPCRPTTDVSLSMVYASPELVW